MKDHLNLTGQIRFTCKEKNDTRQAETLRLWRHAEEASTVWKALIILWSISRAAGYTDTQRWFDCVVVVPSDLCDAALRRLPAPVQPAKSSKERKKKSTRDWWKKKNPTKLYVTAVSGWFDSESIFLFWVREKQFLIYLEWLKRAERERDTKRPYRNLDLINRRAGGETNHSGAVTEKNDRRNEASERVPGCRESFPSAPSEKEPQLFAHAEQQSCRSNRQKQNRKHSHWWRWMVIFKGFQFSDADAEFTWAVF